MGTIALIVVGLSRGAETGNDRGSRRAMELLHQHNGFEGMVVDVCIGIKVMEAIENRVLLFEMAALWRV